MRSIRIRCWQSSLWVLVDTCRGGRTAYSYPEPEGCEDLKRSLLLGRASSSCCSSQDDVQGSVGAKLIDSVLYRQLCSITTGAKSSDNRRYKQWGRGRYLEEEARLSPGSRAAHEEGNFGYCTLTPFGQQGQKSLACG